MQCLRTGSFNLFQDFLALECIKESLESQIGRPPTISEWANAAEMEIGPFSKRLNEGYYSKNRMIQCNLRLVISVAKKYEGKGLSLEDLIQVRGFMKTNLSLLLYPITYVLNLFCYLTCLQSQRKQYLFK